MPTVVSTPKSSVGLAYPKVLGWSLRQHIGGGGFSKVFKGVNPAHPTHKHAAVKVVSLLRNPPPDRRALQKEVQIHALLKHQHILTFLGVEERGVTGMEKGRYLPGVYIVLELAGGGDLFDKITPDVGVETDLAHFYFTQLVSGLEYLHHSGIAHRDIKPENMLLDDQGNLKIADFGLCSVYKHKGREREMKGACGSLPYIAPEMNGRPYKGEPVDVWSAGVVLFALLVGNTPWDEPTSRSPEYCAYMDGTLFDYDPWNRIPGNELSLLKGMLSPDPSKRLSIAALKRHRWYTRNNPLLATDPATLAEKLLHGLIVNGEMDYAAPMTVEERAKQLHSDGARAELPDSISLTQPEAMHNRSLHLGSGGLSMPMSTGQPRSAARADFLTSLSQQLSVRRSEFQATQAAAASQAVGTDFDMGASQFTQAMNFFTKDTLTNPSALSVTPNLTRFVAQVSAVSIAARLAAVLHSMRVQHTLEPIGDTFISDDVGDDDSQGDIDAVPDLADLRVTDEDMEMEDQRPASERSAESSNSGMTRSSSGGSDTVTITGHTGGSATAANGNSTRRGSPNSSSSIPEGSKGIRIRVALTDSRKCALRGEIRIERLHNREQRSSVGLPHCMVSMRRSRGNPLEWRKVFGKIVRSDGIKDCVCR